MLEKLKIMIDEENYPYFEEWYLLDQLAEIDPHNKIELNNLVKELCLKKAGIPELKIGDVTIPSPKDHFLNLAQRYHINQTRVVTRADE